MNTEKQGEPQKEVQSKFITFCKYGFALLIYSGSGNILLIIENGFLFEEKGELLTREKNN